MAPPMQYPWTAASTGLRHLSTAVNDACRRWMVLRSRRALRPTSLPSWPASEASIIRSMPAEKCLPAPLMTTTRTASVSSIHWKMSMISSQKAAFIALSFSGRLICTWATLSLSSTLNALYLSVSWTSWVTGGTPVGKDSLRRMLLHPQGRTCAKNWTACLACAAPIRHRAPSQNHKDTNSCPAP
ncbi:hypothetical protein D3C76_1041850 [compost metagenome]